MQIPDSKYESLPTYLVLNKGLKMFTGYDFPDNTMTVDSIINCYVTNFKYCIIHIKLDMNFTTFI